MVEESKYFTDEKCFNKELSMIKKDNEDFEISNKGCVYDHVYVEGDVKVSYHCLITGKYRGSVHSDWNTNLKLNHKIPMIGFFTT